jgi:hypothetical protein
MHAGGMSQKVHRFHCFIAVIGTAFLLTFSSRAQGRVEILPILTGPGFPPPNDSFTNATELDGYFIETSGTNVDATAEPGEPDHNGSFATRSVWWKWTAPEDGTVEIQSTVTRGPLVRLLPGPNSVDSGTVILPRPPSQFRIELSVYTGTELTDLTSVLLQAFSPAGSTERYPPMRYRFQATAGQTYYIAANSSAQYEFDLTLVLAGVALVQPDHVVAGRSVDLEFAPLNTNLDIVELEAFVGTNSLGIVTNPPFRFSYTPDAAGFFNFSAIGTDSAGQPVVALSTTVLVRPANDDFADAFVIPGDQVNGSFSGDCHYASAEPGEATPTNPYPATVWWRWKPAFSGEITITPTPDFFTKVHVYVGEDFNVLLEMAPTYGSFYPPPPVGVPQSYMIRFRPQPGATYYIAGDGTGPFSFILDQQTLEITPPDNGLPLRAHVGTPVPLEAIWNGPNSPAGPVDFVGGLGLLGYTSDFTLETEHIASVESAPYQAIWVPSLPGLHYVWARTTNSSGFTKESSKTEFLVFEANDDFTNATLVPADTRQTNYATSMAGSAETGEPFHGTTPARWSLWWKWTPSYSGSVHFKAVRSMQGLPLDIFIGDNFDNLRRIASNDKRTYLPGISGAVSLSVRAGRTYYIRADDLQTPASPGLQGTPIGQPQADVVLTLEPAKTPLHGEIYLSLARGSTFAPSARVYLPDGRTPVTGANFHAQLYVGTSPENLKAVGPQLPFYPGYIEINGQDLAGTFPAVPVLLPNTPAYSWVMAQVRVWDSSYGDSYQAAVANGGLCGASRVLRVRAGSEILGPAPLREISSFKLRQMPAANRRQ